MIKRIRNWWRRERGWIHIAVTQREGATKLYVNGKQEGSYRPPVHTFQKWIPPE